MNFKNNGLFWIVSVIFVMFGVMASFFVYSYLDNSSKKEVINRANTIAELLPKTSFGSLSHSEEDLNNSDYQTLKNLMQRVKYANPDMRFSSLVGLDSKGYYFIADGEDPENKADYSPPGQRYEEAPKELDIIFRNSKEQAFYYKDRWGSFLGGYVPVFNENNKVVAAFAIDILAKKQQLQNWSLTAIPFLMSIMLSFLLLYFTTYLRQKEGKMQDMLDKVETIRVAEKEVQGPLASIRSEIESLIAAKHNDAEVGVLKEIYKQSLDVINGVDNVLKVAFVDVFGVMKLKKESLSLTKEMEILRKDFSMRLSGKNLKINIEHLKNNDIYVNTNAQNFYNSLTKVLRNICFFARFDSDIVVYAEDFKGKTMLRFEYESFEVEEKYRNYFILDLAQSNLSSFVKDEFLFNYYVAQKVMQTLGGNVSYKHIGEKSEFVVELNK